MARYLQQLLGASEPLFSAGLKKLERATGNKGIDAKLIGDIHTKAYAVMRKLGLDPANTTVKELYHALHGTLPKALLQTTAYVGLVTVDGLVSFNANDVKRNKHRAFAERTFDAMRQALLVELQQRYTVTSPEASVHVSELLKDSGLVALKLDNNKEKTE